MLSHEQIWAAIDALAARHGLSASGLARRAGLDPTTFNPSKRVAGDGRPRWPSTESLAKILEATGESLHIFVAAMQQAPATDTPDFTVGSDVPLVPLAGIRDVPTTGAFDARGQPTGRIWDRIAFPDPQAKGLFALEISGQELTPFYRDGDVVIVAPTSAIRRGDRVVVKPQTGPLLLYLLHRQTSNTMEFRSMTEPETRYSMDRSEIEWVARIIWASQ
ncbi:MAG: helix-turn-helix transcriptional regulator [Roseibium sp.]|nr:helix-turn-helix transcriptional regulator [Roseibium sp.]